LALTFLFIGIIPVWFWTYLELHLVLKAIIKLEDVHLSQALKSLEAYNLEIGMLLNFGAKSLEYKRLINPKFNQLNQKNQI
jgi:hypothetical protein